MKNITIKSQSLNGFIILFIFFLIIGIYAEAIFAQTQHCCWMPIVLTPNQSFEGKVVSVAPEKQEIAIDINQQKYNFKFDKESGSKQQETLLYKAQPGDIMRGEKMDNKDMYHFEKKTP